jgi:hypothetical protein
MTIHQAKTEGSIAWPSQKTYSCCNNNYGLQPLIIHKLGSQIYLYRRHECFVVPFRNHCQDNLWIWSITSATVPITLLKIRSLRHLHKTQTRASHRVPLSNFRIPSATYQHTIGHYNIRRKRDDNPQPFAHSIPYNNSKITVHK